MKLLVDENLSPRWVAALRTAGFLAEHWTKLGPKGATDTDIMTFARDGQWIVITHDLDFSAILAATGGEKPSVIQLRADDISPESLLNIVVQGIRASTDALNRGAVVSVGLDWVRVRPLPL